MKTQRIAMLLGVMLFLTITSLQANGQTVSPGKQYVDMSRAERLVFVGEQARRIAREMSGSEYEFTTDFEVDIQKAVTRYAERIGKSGRSDLRLVLERGQANAPVIIAAFRARNVSPFFGLYLPFIESEYNNLGPSGPNGALGMFQFLPSTGERYGLSTDDLMDVGKSADAAARYIADSLHAFSNDPMKEALALLAYNRGAQKTARELQVLLTEQNKRCSICAMTADRSKLDETFRQESVFYVPRFFAAAIIGENPQVFGVKMQPLSAN
ncbi:MAG TPA: transglycosylase SLT domain-containing protein [Pyrinomonadaceae bacterium]|nr:transglycosylase SLT domain-containing protein [Pyrinomonadaceae bacterium]